ncbi:hypothetical protein DID80_07345 [Candidatus Marinamargulisbacteria bacterium SCGC AAA071-K20]|nr:hypothetical protein DID80_07345 [Candidatus Marinamargulisbacteria bacterium SCGC AAA071-K20]
MKWNKTLDTGDIVLGDTVTITLAVEADTHVPGLKTKGKSRPYFK